MLLVGTVIGADFLYTDFTRKTNVYVPLNNVKDNDILFFYRDDCSSCKKIFQQVLHEKIIKRRSIKFINMNNKKNQKYIERFQIRTVPIFLKRKKDNKYTMYIGSSQKILNRVFEK